MVQTRRDRSFNSFAGHFSRLENECSRDLFKSIPLNYIYLYFLILILILSCTPPINVNFAICASGFKTRFLMIFNFTVTNIFPNELFVTITFFMRRHRPPPPVQNVDINVDIYTFGDITTFLSHIP